MFQDSTPRDHLERASAELRRGAVYGIDGQIVASAEAISPALLTAMQKTGSVTLALTDRRAAVLKLRAYDDAILRVSCCRRMRRFR